MLKNMKLSTKLICSFGIVLILLVGIIVIYQYSITFTTTGFEDLLQSEIAIANHAAEVEALMLQCRRNEKDFLLRMDKQYVEEYKQNVAALIQEAQAIVQLVEQSGDEENAAKVLEIIGYAKAYAKSFEDLVAAWERKGLDHESGLQGTFRSTAHDLEKMMEKHIVDDLYIAWLQMRRYEKDYVRTKSDADKQKFLARIETYQNLLETSTCEATAKQAQENALRVYRDTVNKYFAETDESSYQQNQLYEEIRSAANDMEEVLDQVYVYNAEALLLQIRRNEKDYLLRGDEEYVQAAHNTITALLNAFKGAGVLQKHIDAMETNLNTYKEAFDALVAEDKNIVAFTATMRDAVHKIEPKADDLYKTAMEAADAKADTTKAAALSYSNRAIGIGIVAVVLGILLSLFIIVGVLNQLGADPSVVANIAQKVGVGDLSAQFDTRRKAVKGVMVAMKTMVSNLRDTVQVAEQIAKGDLNVSVNILSDKDTLGKSLATMVTKLREVVVDVKGAAGNVTSGSQTMSSSSEEMSQGATEQAAAAEEASTSMEQMAANIRQNANNALETEKIAVKAAADAQESGKAVTQALAAIQEIASKITVIEEIARQTHMLSLNATIEAAKAQDYGKGFGVVAAEVRALAERSRTAATEINGLANSSVAIAAKAGEMLTKLVPDIQKTAELVQEISAASNEQSSGAEQINKAIQQLDQVIQQNSSVSEEMAATSEELASQAEHLQSTIEFFKVDESAWKTSVEAKHVQRTPSRARVAHMTSPKEVEAEKETGDDKPTGPVFHMGPNGVQGDEQDEEFERF